jgi:hypothetical protein
MVDSGNPRGRGIGIEFRSAGSTQKAFVQKRRRTIVSMLARYAMQTAIDAQHVFLAEHTYLAEHSHGEFVAEEVDWYSEIRHACPSFTAPCTVSSRDLDNRARPAFPASSSGTFVSLQWTMTDPHQQPPGPFDHMSQASSAMPHR